MPSDLPQVTDDLFPDPAYFRELSDQQLRDAIRRALLEITDADIEYLKPLRNAVSEALDRWSKS